MQNFVPIFCHKERILYKQTFLKERIHKTHLMTY